MEALCAETVAGTIEIENAFKTTLSVPCVLVHIGTNKLTVSKMTTPARRSDWILCIILKDGLYLGKINTFSIKFLHSCLRYFFDIAYKGTHYHGWQIQINAHSVQGELENALQKMFGRKVETNASGRTDTGVHAEQQIVHLDLEEEFTAKHLFRLNCMLPKDIAVKEYFPVQDHAHARFDATSRAYEYRISKVKNPFLIHGAYFFDRPLDLVKMNEAAVQLLNHNDFESFSKVHTDVKHFLCDIYMAKWKEKNDMIYFEIEGNRFLRGMVRAIVGSLIAVGMGKSSPEEFEKIILSRNRGNAGASAPAHGLYLTRIQYPDSVYLEAIS